MTLFDNPSASDHWILPNWPAPKSIKALCTTRIGGHSHGTYQGLNLGLHVGDDPIRVQANRQWLSNRLDNLDIQWLSQTHGTDCIQIDGRQLKQTPEADALWTKTPNLACAIMSADCLPLLMCNEQGTQVCAVHAGWRGLAAGIIDSALATFSQGASIFVWLGPAIGPTAFEVGAEVREIFVRNNPAAAAAFQHQNIATFTANTESHSLNNPKSTKYVCDLYQLAKLQLLPYCEYSTESSSSISFSLSSRKERSQERSAIVKGIYGGDDCTFSDPVRWFSHRRDQPTGRMASLVWIAPT
jgi:YfiH family protein